VIEGLKPYPEMKESGVPWLGKVPANWKHARLKRFLRPIDRRSTTGTETLLSLRRDHGVVVYAEHFSRPPQGATTVGFKLVRSGQLVVNRLQANNGLVFHSRLDGLVSPDYSVLEATQPVLMDYVSELLRTDLYRSHFRRESTGLGTGSAGFLRLYDDRLLQTVVALPSGDEQAAILRFLDHAHRRIRLYISAKQRLIMLLEEKKQAIIHHAVTRGLDPNVGLKPSGVEWPGDVPEHWSVAALRHRYSQCLGKMLDSKRITGSHSLQYLRNTDVQWDQINVAGLPTMDIEPNEYERYTVKTGDLLVCEGGDVGRCALWSGQLELCGFQKALHRLRPRSAAGDTPRFMYYALRAAAQVGAFDDGHRSTIAHLTGDKLRAYRFAYPPFTEQSELVRYLDRSVATLDNAAAAVLKEIALLHEYRTRLIADVVTGKLDVCEAAARLPEEGDEPELTDEADATMTDADDEADEVGTAGEAEG
jgi:type I restriction enzyme S subunit